MLSEMSYIRVFALGTLHEFLAPEGTYQDAGLIRCDCTILKIDEKQIMLHSVPQLSNVHHTQ